MTHDTTSCTACAAYNARYLAATTRTEQDTTLREWAAHRG